MHDNAPPHVAAVTLDDLRARGISTIAWPAFSPDLNPIESLWVTMKDYIDLQNTHVSWSYERLRTAYRAAWDTITEDTLQELVDSMPERIEAVIAANGLYTRW